MTAGSATTAGAAARDVGDVSGVVPRFQFAVDETRAFDQRALQCAREWQRVVDAPVRR